MKKRIKNPLIISGDFNDTVYASKNKTLVSFIDDLHLKAYDIHSHELKTHPSDNPKLRIDWTLISQNLEFKKYETLQAQCSDHLPVFSVVTYTK